jgi:tetratricopeptide (TPR) repeat protein
MANVLGAGAGYGCATCYQAGTLELYNPGTGDLNIQSAIGVLSAQLGRTDEAIDVFRSIVAADAADLAAAETEKARLDVEADAAGGYARLPMAARERRDVLTTQIATLRSQLHLTHRNIALVYREAGQTDQALLAAQEAARYASEAQRPAIESLISDLQSEKSQ